MRASTSSSIKFAFDREQNRNYPLAQGGVALLFQNHMFALQSGVPVLANLVGEAVAFDGVEASTIAHKTASRPLDHVGYMDVSHAGVEQGSHLKLNSLLQNVRNESGEKLTCALGSVATNFGYVGKASPALSLLKAINCLRQRYVPAVAQWSGFKCEDYWTDTPFYLPQQSNYWFVDGMQARVATVHAVDADGQHQHMVLTQGNATSKASPLVDQNHLFIPVSANTESELVKKLTAIKQEINNSHEAETIQIVTDAIAQFVRDQSHSHYALVVQGRNAECLLTELQSMLYAVCKTMATDGEWRTPRGSYFSAKPIGGAGVAFVYPGVGMTYPGLAQTLHRYFPEAYDAVDEKGMLGELLQHKVLFPRAIEPLSQVHEKQAEAEHRKDLSSLATVGVGSAKLFTQVLRHTFNIEPKYALGYSMGEVSMWSGLGVWNEPVILRTRIRNSEVFQQQITGELLAVKTAWAISETPAWDSFTLKVDYKQVEAILPNYPKAYLSIVNGDTCVVAGDPDSCMAIASELSCTAMASGFVTAIHTEPAKSIYAPLLEMFDLAINKPQSVRFLSAANVDAAGADCVPVLQTRKNIAQSVAKAFTSPLYFSKLVQGAHQQGAKLFVEVGAGRSCSTLVNKILKGQHHTAVPVNNKGQGDQQAMLNMLAQLVSHKVPMDLSPLLINEQTLSDWKAVLTKQVWV